MLKLFTSFHQLDIAQLMLVYAEENRKTGKRSFAYLNIEKQLCRAEEEFAIYLQDVFFRQRVAIYAVWMADGRYKAALRLEPYRDGLLLEALETAPESRRRGYAFCLMKAVLNFLKTTEYRRLYSHVHKRNFASMSLHQKCGFQVIADYAEFIDGTVTQNSYTLCYQLM